MAKEYFAAYHSYLKSIEPLNDAERGRLFTAMLEYSITGAAQELRGNERFVFPTIREQIDRDAKRYADFCGKQRENGRTGGRPPKQPVGDAETQTFSEQPKKAQEKEKTMTKTMTKTKAKATATATATAAGGAAGERPCARREGAWAHTPGRTVGPQAGRGTAQEVFLSIAQGGEG